MPLSVSLHRSCFNPVYCFKCWLCSFSIHSLFHTPVLKPSLRFPGAFVRFHGSLPAGPLAARARKRHRCQLPGADFVGGGANGEHSSFGLPLFLSSRVCSLLSVCVWCVCVCVLCVCVCAAWLFLSLSFCACPPRGLSTAPCSFDSDWLLFGNLSLPFVLAWGGVWHATNAAVTSAWPFRVVILRHGDAFATKRTSATTL